MPSFLSESEQSLCDKFLEKGIVKIPVEDINSLDKIRGFVASKAGSDLNGWRRGLGSTYALNDYRVGYINDLNNEAWVPQAYYSLARNALNTIVGNELVMQRRINLSIQLPNDDSSLLPIHCDTWSGDSPYEVVLWVPLVDCYDTKSMFFCDKRFNDQIMHDFSTYKNSEELYQSVKDHVQFMDVKYGECLIFTQNIMHGNRVNMTNETRWSLNCRFKSALSPYGDKKLGEFFEPITLRPATKMGMNYQYPACA